jgi:hypothetical protein
MARKVMYFRVGGRDVHLPKLIGAFILLAALLFFVQASAKMFESWDNLKAASACIDKANEFSDNLNEMTYCQDQAKKSLDLFVRIDQDKLTMKQFFGTLLGPIATVMVWLAVLFFGWIIYRSGDLVLPIEETIRDVSDRKRKK